MSTRRAPYTYVVLRYRHDPIAGEMLNVGVIIHSSEARFVGARISKASGRISKAFPDLDGGRFRATLRAVERAFEKVETRAGADLLLATTNASELAQRIIPADDGTLIWSDVGSGIAENMAATLEGLFVQFVSRLQDAAERHRTDADVWRPLRDRLQARQMADIFQPKTIRSVHTEVQFEHAMKNGKWHCFQPLSFDLLTAEGIQEKAAKWVGNILGLSKGEEIFRPHFVVGKPGSVKLIPAYERALGLLQEAPLEPESSAKTGSRGSSINWRPRFALIPRGGGRQNASLVRGSHPLTCRQCDRDNRPREDAPPRIY